LALHELGDPEYGALFSALQRDESYLPPERLTQRVTESIPKLGARDAEAVVAALLSVQTGRNNHGASLVDFAQGIATSEDLALSADASERLARRIETLAGLPAMAITAKAMDVAGEHDRLFHTARMLTDVRPVFGDDPLELPVGAVVTHVLRIDAFRNGQLEDYFVVLDNSELMALKAVVDRAIDKNKSLSRLLDVIGFSRFELSEED
jgi:hypothetical protein